MEVGVEAFLAEADLGATETMVRSGIWIRFLVWVLSQRKLRLIWGGSIWRYLLLSLLVQAVCGSIPRLLLVGFSCQFWWWLDLDFACTKFKTPTTPNQRRLDGYGVWPSLWDGWQALACTWSQMSIRVCSLRPPSTQGLHSVRLVRLLSSVSAEASFSSGASLWPYFKEWRFTRWSRGLVAHKLAWAISWWAYL